MVDDLNAKHHAVRGHCHRPVIFNILDPFGTMEALDAVETLTDWELFQSFVSELLSPNT
jgi:hypothetical protein